MKSVSGTTVEASSMSEVAMVLSTTRTHSICCSNSMRAATPLRSGREHVLSSLALVSNTPTFKEADRSEPPLAWGGWGVSNLPGGRREEEEGRDLISCTCW